ncbi:hypothetical protein CQ12_40300 [Bradyrhizobium jicamae]|uniref:Uncharacterized protein n=1 Tax=Bradyrhizobium jicamae TaxID=280332 RepID=A0A0R3LL34_9BRAD|nr:hypothetical protein CQ12_40300 [Bradyrhizobium jicamae]
MVLTVGIKLCDLQTKALESQLKAVEAQNEVLNQTQYDRALSMINSQRELFDKERVSLEKQVADLSASGKDRNKEIAQLQQRLSALDSAKRAVEEKAQALSKTMFMLMQEMWESGKSKLPGQPAVPSR